MLDSNKAAGDVDGKVYYEVDWVFDGHESGGKVGGTSVEVDKASKPNEAADNVEDTG
jgi:hypothetical protein